MVKTLGKMVDNLGSVKREEDNKERFNKALILSFNLIRESIENKGCTSSDIC